MTMQWGVMSYQCGSHSLYDTVCDATCMTMHYKRSEGQSSGSNTLGFVSITTCTGLGLGLHTVFVHGEYGREIIVWN